MKVSLASIIEEDKTIDGVISFKKDLLEPFNIKSIDKAKYHLEFYLDSSDSISFDLNLEGVIVYNDLDEKKIKIEESELLEDFFPHLKEEVDIYDLLWQNIVLELPR